MSNSPAVVIRDRKIVYTKTANVSNTVREILDRKPPFLEKWAVGFLLLLIVLTFCWINQVPVSVPVQMDGRIIISGKEMRFRVNSRYTSEIRHTLSPSAEIQIQGRSEIIAVHIVADSSFLKDYVFTPRAEEDLDKLQVGEGTLSVRINGKVSFFQKLISSFIDQFSGTRVRTSTSIVHIFSITIFEKASNV